MKTHWHSRWSLGLIVAASLAGPTLAEDSKPEAQAPEPQPPRIQLAILLDTSGSMSGLINQARTQLWKIVNELATAKQDGQVPDLEVALYEYGKSSIPAEQGHLRQIVGLTDDLDKLSEELFALTTNGGSEHCGQVIDAATKHLSWSDSEKDLKLIFIAGNEPFTQGPVKYQDACSAAIAKGIVVNTIFCGQREQGVNTGWQDGAKLADGSFMHIDQNQRVATIETPYDKQLTELSSQINRTYVLFGRAEVREELSKRQLKADAAAAGAAPAAAAERAAFKASAQYSNADRDLVEAVKSGKVKLSELEADQLPKELKELSVEEQKTFLAKKESERSELQQQIKALSEKRNEFLVELRKKQAAESKNETLDTAIISTLRQQAARKQFRIDEK